VSAHPGPARQASGIVVGESPLRIWGLPSALRLERQLALAGALSDEARATRRVLLRADWVYDDALVRGLVAAESDLALRAVDGIAVALNVAAADAADAAALLAAGRAPASAREVSAATLADGFNNALRKREPPYLLPLGDATLPAIEQRVFGRALPAGRRACAPAPASRRTRSRPSAWCWCSPRWRCSGPGTTRSACWPPGG
jgi:hypothetical protein